MCLCKFLHENNVELLKWEFKTVRVTFSQVLLWYKSPQIDACK